MRGRAALGGIAATVAAVSLLLSAGNALAAFPGANGKLAFTTGYDGLYTVNPDGTGEVRLGPCAVGGCFDARWSPDGSNIAYATNCEDCAGGKAVYMINADGTGNHQIFEDAWDLARSPDGTKFALQCTCPPGLPGYGLWITEADGTNRTQVTTAQSDNSPEWSPDGDKLAFGRSYTDEVGHDHSEIYTVNVDGTGLTKLTNDPGGFATFPAVTPTWSPDGERIMFRAGIYDDNGLWVVNADGTGLRKVTSGGGGDPVWSPDGSRVAFARFRQIGLMNADGTGEMWFAERPAQVSGPDWQRLPVTNYEHPQGAPSLSTALVPVSKQCGTGGNPANASHAPPLAGGSCSPPSPSSAVVHIGPQMQGSAALTVTPGDTDPTNGDQADVALVTTLSDIQTIAGGDYDPNPSGADLTQVVRLRLTDQANGYGGTSATASDVDFAVPIDCTPTADPAVGSKCAVNTTADSVMPGFAQEQRQAVAQIFRVRVYDSGLNGTHENGTGDDKLFAHEGVFVP